MLSGSSTAFFDDNYQAQEIAKTIRAMLNEDELKVISLADLIKASTNNRIAYCQNVINGRYVPPAEQADEDDDLFFLDFNSKNIFLMRVEALFVHGVTPAKFLQLDSEKQTLLTRNDIVCRLMDIGIEFEKLLQLNNNDLRQVVEWKKDDDASKYLLFFQKNESKEQKELKEFIDSKLTGYSQRNFNNSYQ